MDDSGQIVLFQTQGGETKIEVRLSNETVWLTADQMAEMDLFSGAATAIVRSNGKPGPVTLRATAPGVKAAQATVTLR